MYYMRKNKVLISCKKKNAENYVSALNKQNLKPVFDIESNADALMLCGGEDVCPCLYGKTPLNTDEIDVTRDCVELYLIKKFLSENKPVFGICRGLQILNVFFGGTLLQNVKNLEIHSRLGGKNDKIHLNRTINGTFCHEIYGAGFTSNSAHHQSVEKLGSGMKASCHSLDGTIEAIYGDNVFAVQFHPERMNDDETSDGERVFGFFKSVISKRT